MGDPRASSSIIKMICINKGLFPGCCSNMNHPLHQCALLGSAPCGRQSAQWESQALGQTRATICTTRWHCFPVRSEAHECTDVYFPRAGLDIHALPGKPSTAHVDAPGHRYLNSEECEARIVAYGQGLGHEARQALTPVLRASTSWSRYLNFLWSQILHITV